MAGETGVSTKDGTEVRLYTTREERREAGTRYSITDWLSVFALLELEYDRHRLDIVNGSSSADDQFAETLEVGFEFEPLSWLKAELIYEYDGESNTLTLDEALAAAEAADFELELGKLYVPFGVYYSNFITGPLLEFGETRARAASLSYGPDDLLDVTAFGYLGKAGPAGTSGHDVDWGFAVEASPFEYGTFGLSYLSDLADSDERLLEDNDNEYERRVDGLGAYAVLGYENIEVTLEFIGALKRFRELDADRARPRAWNLELAYFPDNALEWAVRLEGSQELEDAPRFRAGIAAAWRFANAASLQVEYLRGEFAPGLATDKDDRELDSIHQVAAQISFAF